MHASRKFQLVLLLLALLLAPGCKSREPQEQQSSAGGDKVLSDYVHQPLDAASAAKNTAESRDSRLDDEAREMEEEGLENQESEE